MIEEQTFTYLTAGEEWLNFFIVVFLVLLAFLSGYGFGDGAGMKEGYKRGFHRGAKVCADLFRVGGMWGVKIWPLFWAWLAYWAIQYGGGDPRIEYP